jgi:hypothetical protein
MLMYHESYIMFDSAKLMYHESYITFGSANYQNSIVTMVTSK